MCREWKEELKRILKVEEDYKKRKHDDEICERLYLAFSTKKNIYITPILIFHPNVA